MKNEIMTTKQAAELLGIAPASVSRLIRQDKLKGERFGRDWLVYRESVEIYLEKFGNLPKNDPRRGKF